MRERTILALMTAVALLGCIYEPGCGYFSSDETEMARLKEEMDRAGIPYDVLSDGAVRCEAEDSERFRVLLGRLERQSDARLQEKLNEMSQVIGTRLDEPGGNLCLSKVLSGRGIDFSERMRDGEVWIYWRPASEADKDEIMAATGRCLHDKNRQPPPNNALEQNARPAASVR
jgi:hypothetical protein